MEINKQKKRFIKILFFPYFEFKYVNITFPCENMCILNRRSNSSLYACTFTNSKLICMQRTPAFQIFTSNTD